MDNMNTIWGVQEIWNKQLSDEVREPKERNYISASDIGGSFLDRYYKMKGVAPTNPPDERTLRIFSTGKHFESLIIKVFLMAGLLLEYQPYVEIPATKTRLKVLGYGDAIIGGKPNWDLTKEKIDKILQLIKTEFKVDEKALSELFFDLDKSKKLVEQLHTRYGDEELAPLLTEIKSVNSMAFWAHKNTGQDGYFRGYDHHKLQLATYLMAKGKDVGRLFYISRDDECLQEGW